MDTNPVPIKNTQPIPSQTDCWMITGVDPIEGIFSLMRDQAEEFLTSYRTDLMRDRDLLYEARQGDILWVLWPSGTGLFCRDLYRNRMLMRFAAQWLSAMAQDSRARFYTGKILDNAGLIRRISREEAIKRMGRWVFEAA